MINRTVNKLDPQILGAGYRIINEKKLRRTATLSVIMFAWILVWALIFKMGNELLILRNHSNLSALTLEERIIWDLFPFRYRGDELMIFQQKVNTVLNCFVFAPFGVLLQFAFKRKNISRDILLCLCFCILIEATQTALVVGNWATEDFITNIAGYFVGLVIYLIFFKRLTIRQSTKFFGVVNIILFAILLFSVFTMIQVRETLRFIINDISY